MDNNPDNRFEPLEADQGWDTELARDLIGATLFVGITYRDNAGNFLQKEQIFGRVESVSEGAGIKIIQTNGEPYILAPVLDAVEPGDDDAYQLSANHERVEYPDYVMWVDSIRPPLN